MALTKNKYDVVNLTMKNRTNTANQYLLKYDKGSVTSMKRPKYSDDTDVVQIQATS